MIWTSQLQTEIALSSTESEYTGLSYALRVAIPLVTLLKELKEHGFPVDKTKASVQFKVFEDNSGAIEIATSHKWRPRTKHLNCHLHHFWSYVPHSISIQHIPTDKQPADILKKSCGPKYLVSTSFLVNGVVRLSAISQHDGTDREGVLR